MFVCLAQVSKRDKLVYRIFMSFSFAILVLFAGLRSVMVGTDTGNYIGIFNLFKSDLGLIFELDTSIEFGFILLQGVAASISHNYWSILTVIAIAGLAPTYRTISKLSVNTIVSVFIYVTLASYVFLFNGARQGLAAAIYGIALVHLVNKKFIRYTIWVIIAAFFHKTVVIMLPLYFVLRMKFSFFRMIIISSVAFIILTFLGTFLSFLDGFSGNKYDMYIDRGASGGVLLGIFFAIISIFLIFLRRFIKERNYYLYDIYLNLCVINSIIYLVVISAGADVNVLRLSLYFSFGYIFIWPIIFQDIKIFREPLICLAFTLVHLVFYYVYLSKMSSLVPYEFNPILF
jgi:hypothetical protein